MAPSAFVRWILLLTVSAGLGPFDARSAQAAGDAPSRDDVIALSVRLTALADKDRDVRTLIEEAVARSEPRTLVGLLSNVRYCDATTSQYAAVKQRIDENFVYLARILDEPVAAEDEAGLKRFYVKTYQSALSDMRDPERANWDFEPDLVIVHRGRSHRQICIRPGEKLDQSVDAVLHEFVHFARIAADERHDILSYRDVEDYARATILAPGEEVDAYVFQYTVAVRAEGRTIVGAPPALLRVISPAGDLIGGREELVPYVLGDLGYLKKRFEPEYRSQLEELGKRLENRRKVMTEILATRKKQITELQKRSYDRVRVLDYVWPSYADDSKRVTKMLAAAEASRDRLAKSVDAADDLADEIRKKIAAIP